MLFERGRGCGQGRRACEETVTDRVERDHEAFQVLQIAYLPVPADYSPSPDPGAVYVAPDGFTPEWLRANARDAEIVITNSLRGMSTAEVDALPRLKLIACFGGSLDRVAVDAAHARGVAVSATPDLLSDDAADLVLCFALSLFRDVPHADRYVRAGEWSGDFPYARSLKGRRLGLFGFGRIGRAVARRAKVFGMEVGCFRRGTDAQENALQFKSLDALAAWCDALVVAAAATPETHGAVNAGVLEALGADGFLINVARGSIVDEAALTDALERRVIAGAALDVYEREPLHDSRLQSLDNVILTPHIASATRDTRCAMANQVYANVAAFRAGKPLNGLAPVRTT
jgi:hydroxypyruvate reductase